MPGDVVSREQIENDWQCWQRGEVPLRAPETDAKMRTPRKAAERSGVSLKSRRVGGSLHATEEASGNYDNRGDGDIV